MAIIHAPRLSFLEEQVLKYLSNLIGKEIPEAVQIIIFGSRARSNSDENSDLDVAVILDISYIDKKMWDRLWDIKWRVLDALNAEEFPLSLSLITINDLISRDFGIEKDIKTSGAVIWKRQD